MLKFLWCRFIPTKTIFEIYPDSYLDSRDFVKNTFLCEPLRFFVKLCDIAITQNPRREHKIHKGDVKIIAFHFTKILLMLNKEKINF
jgi:hypothetical protein